MPLSTSYFKGLLLLTSHDCLTPSLETYVALTSFPSLRPAHCPFHHLKPNSRLPNITCCSSGREHATLPSNTTLSLVSIRRCLTSFRKIIDIFPTGQFYKLETMDETLDKMHNFVKLDKLTNGTNLICLFEKYDNIQIFYKFNIR